MTTRVSARAAVGSRRERLRATVRVGRHANNSTEVTRNMMLRENGAGEVVDAIEETAGPLPEELADVETA